MAIANQPFVVLAYMESEKRCRGLKYHKIYDSVESSSYNMNGSSTIPFDNLHFLIGGSAFVKHFD